MRITQSKLRQIIKEEMSRHMSEMYYGARRPGASPEEIENKIAFYTSPRGSHAWNMTGASFDFEDMASGGDGGGIRNDYYSMWNDEDFQAVIDAVGPSFG